MGGALIEPCHGCSVDLFFEEQDTDCDSDAETVVPKKSKFTSEQLQRKKENREKEMKHRAEIIVRKAREKEEQRLAELRRRKQYREDTLLNLIEPVGNRDVFRKYCQNQPAHLEQFNREYTADDKKMNSTRGCTRGHRGNRMFTYEKPAGYFGYALEVKSGPEIGRKNYSNEWVVAYHGTNFNNIGSILSSQLKAGTRQAHNSRQNMNSMSDGGDVGEGIYLSPDASQAESYGSSNGFYCLLQCRVNPRAVRYSYGNERGYWVVPNGADIIPYRLLFKLNR